MFSNPKPFTKNMSNRNHNRLIKSIDMSINNYYQSNLLFANQFKIEHPDTNNELTKTLYSVRSNK